MVTVSVFIDGRRRTVLPVCYNPAFTGNGGVWLAGLAGIVPIAFAGLGETLALDVKEGTDR